MAEVARHLTESGSTCLCYMLSEDSGTQLAALMRENGAEVVASGSLSDFRRYVLAARPSLIVTFGFKASVLTRAVRAVSRFQLRTWPVLVDARNGLEAGRARWVWMADKVTSSFVDVYLANSDAVRAHLLDRGLPPRKIRVLYSALADQWSMGRSGGAREPLSVAMIGNCRPEKRQELGLAAFSRLTVDARLTVYTNDARRLKSLWNASEAHDKRVEFVEGRTVKPADLDKVAIVLHPSSHESAPRALMEARARGCYVVAFDVGDTARIVGNGGVVLAQDDTVALQEALSESLALSSSGLLDHSPSTFDTVDEYASALLAYARWSRTGKR